MSKTETSLCIDGYPRSANTFLFHAIRYWNPDIRISHHLYLPVLIQTSIRLGIPTVLLIRDPIDAVASTVVVDTNLSPRIALHFWIEYYRRTLAYADRCVIATFENATAAVPVIKELNQRFNLQLNYEPLNSEVQKAIKQNIEAHNAAVKHPSTLLPLPTEEKKRIKTQILPSVQQLPRMAEAYKLYEEFARLSFNSRDPEDTKMKP